MGRCRGPACAGLERRPGAGRTFHTICANARTPSGSTILLSIYCTKEYNPRTRIVTSAIRKSHPALADRLHPSRLRICALLERRRAVLCRDRTRALLTIAYAIITRYRLQKDRRGLLDYDDLIDKTLALFRNTSAAWVLYKLDLGIDHVLIDEAQDTSPRQWDIIRALVERIHFRRRRTQRRAHAVRCRRRQAIDLLVSGRRSGNIRAGRERIQRASFEGAALPWMPVKLQTSFRSGAAVLEAVDIVFKNPQAHAGFVSDRAGTAHSALARCRARHRRYLAARAPRRQEQHRGMGRALRHHKRDQPAGPARAQDRASGRGLDQVRMAAERHHRAGAPARRLVRIHHPCAEGRRNPGRRRRPAGAHRAYRGDGHDRARRRASAAGRRPRARVGPQEPAYSV